MTLKMLRAKYNLTQAQAADKVGVTEGTWSNWENEKSFPDVPKIEKIEQAFDIEYNDIIFLASNTVKP